MLRATHRALAVALFVVSFSTGAPNAMGEAGDALIADFDGSSGEDGLLARLDLRTGRRHLISDNRRSLFSGGPSVLDPEGLAASREGRLFLPSYSGLLGAAAVFEVDPATGSQTVYASNSMSLRAGGQSLLRSPQAVVLLADDDLLVADSGGPGLLIRIDADTRRQSAVASGLGPVRDVALDPAGRAVVVASGVLRVDIATGTRTRLADAASFRRERLNPFYSLPRSVAVMPDGLVLVDTFGGIVEIDGAGGHRLLFQKNEPDSPREANVRAEIAGIVPDGDDAIVFTTYDDFSDSATVERLELTTRRNTVITGADPELERQQAAVLRRPGAVISDPRLGIVVADTERRPVAPGSPGAVISIDKATGRQSVVSMSARPLVSTGAQAFDDITGIALERSGTALVTERFELGGAVLRVDLRTGRQSVVASNQGTPGQPGSGLLDAPRGIALAADGDAYVTVDASDSSPRVLRVDARSGTITRVAAKGLLRRPSGIVVTRGGSLLVADTAAFRRRGGIIRINPRTGRQSVVSSNRRSRRAGAQAPFGEPNALAVGSRGRLYVTDRQNTNRVKAVLVVNVRTGAARQLSTNRISARKGGGSDFQGPRGIAITRSGALLVTDAGFDAQGRGRVIKVDPRTGRQTRVYDNSDPGPDLFDAPSAVLIEPHRATPGRS